MLMPLPARLHELVTRYEALLAEEDPDSGAPDPRLADLAYTLCVSTGTRDITHALEAARAYLATSDSTAPVAPLNCVLPSPSHTPQMA
ncbi:DUF5133 domain-containing protein [Streptomyces sp. SID8366]|uniref:DUF5133 domain-containing protein n=1 Tax=unclassified Streptomyces TaxID=2593676 RepID=UPI000DB92D7F|nr:DUF5133 domain-containing protein [Streptomyces sp. PsTaAH-130]MYU06089.1 DUF5133 domain-containing protein [Streptomyces sp. SID8366]MYU68049.1 DUF5133 domain-containing protein [Streptomyces sp. SID69]RAJ64157.1 uncharacterized protein DUF5133 [Streptomyces sp. PsTaAH-130]